MLTKSNNSFGGDGIVTATSFSIGGGFGDVFGGVSPPAAVTSAGNNVDGLLVTGTSSMIGDSIITFSPVKDAELRRRARNNAILAKIQELEANASVQAARSERLRMMREEYEALVRKYASNGKWNWGQGSSSNGFLNENNGHRQPTYLGRYNSQQQPFIFAPGPVQQLLASTTTASPAPENVPFHAFHPPSTSFQRGMEYNNANNINPSFTTTVGVNTDITGPVRPADADVLPPATLEKDNDLPRWSANSERKRVTVVVDTGSQTEGQTEKPPASAVLLSSGPLISDDGKRANQTSIVMAGIKDEKREVSFLGKGNNPTMANKKLSMNMEMMMMLEDEDDESLLEAHQRAKLQREHLHRQLKQPKGVQVQVQATSHSQDQPVDETPSNNSSPSAVSSPLGEVPSTSNTTEEVFRLRQRQEKQQQQESKKKASESGGSTSKKAFQGNMTKETTEVDRLNEISSVETTTASQANKDPGDKLSKSIRLRHEMADLSLSDSNSVFQIQKHNLQRKKLMEELAATTALRNRKNKAGHGDDIGDRAEDTTINDSEDDDDEDDETKDKSGLRSELASQGAEQSGKKKEIANEEETIQQCSSPTTAGATSESIGDSMMDSIQKTPDTLPRDDSELHGIVEEANEEEPEEIELDHNVSLAGGNNADESVRESEEDDVLEALLAASNNGMGGWKTISALSGGGSGGANERPSNGGRISLKTESREEIKELVAHRHHEEEEDEINDAEEIRSNNLSSSKLGVLVEEENFPHANNPGETNSGSMTGLMPAKSSNFPTVPSAFQHDAFAEGEREQKKVATGVYEDMGGHRKESMFQVKEKDEEEVHEKEEISQSDSDAINELKRKNKIYSYAPSANMPAPNVFSALNVTDGANDESRLSKGQSSILPPASSSPPGHLSTGSSSSSSSSRQHSFDELGGDDAGMSDKSIPKTMERRGSGSEQDWSRTKEEQGQQQNCLPTSPQAVNKRHPQLQQQIKKGGNKKTSATLQGTDMMPERLNSYPKSATNMVPDNDETKEKGTTLEKTTKASLPTTSSPLFSSTKKGGGSVPGGSESSSANMMAESPHGTTAVNLNGSENNEGVTNIPANNVRAAKMASRPSPAKPGGGGIHHGGATTTPSGITGANNTAKRFRLKLNYDDSESDSSEIGPAKGNSKPGPANIGSHAGSQQMNVTAGQKSTSRSQPQTGSITGGTKVEGNESEKVPAKKQEEKDDDFDDFFDI